MYDNRFLSHLYYSSHLTQAFTNSAKRLDTPMSTLPLESDRFPMFDQDEKVAMMPTDGGAIPVSPQALITAPLRPSSPTTSDTDSECLDDGSDSPSSFTGEECPDLCGGPKYSCRTWTPPPSPFYYTNESGIFLLEDRQNFEERQKIELDHTMRELAARLQQLEEDMTPPRVLSQLLDVGNLTPLSPGAKAHGPSEEFSPSSTEEFVEYSHDKTASPEQSPCGCGSTQHTYKLSMTRNAAVDSSHNAANVHEKGEMETADLGMLIHTSLQHVQSTNSPPKYLANVSEPVAPSLPREPVIIMHSPEEPRDDALLTRHTSPHLHLGDTAYPTPLPSSPETRPSRKRGRYEGSHQSIGRKRRREEVDDWVSTHALEAMQ